MVIKMADWNSTQYLKFKKERTQPSLDLISRLTSLDPKRALDIGCGPGNSTFALKSQFPNADITGVDYSDDMLKKAKEIQWDYKNIVKRKGILERLK